MKLTKDIIVVGTGCSAALADNWLGPIQAACDKFAITTPEGVASFLANIGVESGGLTALVENMNYSAAGLARTWPQRYAIDAHMQVKLPNSTAYFLANKPQAIANNVYANRMGNGQEMSGDGWKYRGRGPIHLTGRNNIVAFFDAVGLPLDSDPALLEKPELGAMSAAFFYTKLSNAYACSASSFDDTVKAVNGQGPCPANQGDLRSTRYNAVLAALQAAVAPAPAPAKKVAPKPAETSTK